MTLDQRFWYGLIAVAAIVEIEAVHNGRQDGTLSHAVRCACKTQTRAGQVGLYAGWALLSSWLVPHLCKQVVAEMEAVTSDQA